MILREDEKQALLEGIRKLSDIFWGPEPYQCEELLSDTYWPPFKKINLFLDPTLAPALNNLITITQTFSDTKALCADMEEAYVRLFISDRKGIRTPLYASCYEGEDPTETRPLMGEPALAMKQRYLSKGLSLAEDIGEPPDHLSIELEYLYFLLEKGWIEKDDILLEEAFSFGSEIMLPWVIKLQERLAGDEIENRFYPLITALLCAILKLVGRLNKTL